MSTNLASLLKYWVGSMERLRIFEKWKVWKGFHGKEEGVVLSWNLKGFWIWTRSSFGVRSNGRVQCPSTLLPITIHGPLRKCTVGGGKCEKHKVRKGWKGKEEEVKCSTNLKGFWIWKRSSFGVRSYGRVQCPSTLLPSSGTDWLLWEVSLWKMWKTQSPKRTS